MRIAAAPLTSIAPLAPTGEWMGGNYVTMMVEVVSIKGHGDWSDDGQYIAGENGNNCMFKDLSSGQRFLWVLPNKHKDSGTYNYREFLSNLAIGEVFYVRAKWSGNLGNINKDIPYLNIYQTAIDAKDSFRVFAANGSMVSNPNGAHRGRPPGTKNHPKPVETMKIHKIVDAGQTVGVRIIKPITTTKEQAVSPKPVPLYYSFRNDQKPTTADTMKAIENLVKPPQAPARSATETVGRLYELMKTRDALNAEIEELKKQIA